MGPITLGRLLALAFLLRAGVGCGVQVWLDRQPDRDFVVAGDADGYWELGERIARGEPYELYTPPRRAMRMPGYPLFLAGVFSVFGESFWAVRIASALVGTAAVALVYLLGKELHSEQVGLWGAAWQTLSPMAIGFSALILCETLFALTLLFSLWTAARWLKPARGESSSIGWACLTGLGVAAATYVRPSWYPALALIPLWGVVRWRTRAAVGQGLCVVASGLLLLFPWAWRNHAVTGHWIFTTLWMGPSLYDGLNPDADGASEMSFFERDNVMGAGGLSEYEMNRHYRDAAVAFVREQPGRAWSLVLSHARRYWSPWPNAEQFRSLPSVVVIGGFTSALFVFAVAGLWRIRRAATALLLIAGPIVAFAILHLAFVGSIRYRLPAEYPLAVAAAIGWCAWLDRRRPSRGEEHPSL